MKHGSNPVRRMREGDQRQGTRLSSLWCPQGRTQPPQTEDSALWEKRWGITLETGLFKDPPQLAWAQVMIRDLESRGVNMQRVYEKSRATAAITRRMQGVEIPTYEELMKMDLNPPSS